MRLYYDERGLDRYYGLLELGEIGGLWKNVAGRYEIDGKKVYAKAIYKDPESYFTPEVMEKLDELLRKSLVMEVEVFDNFLPSFQFDLIQSFFMGENVAWYWRTGAVFENELEMIINLILLSMMRDVNLIILL